MIENKLSKPDSVQMFDMYIDREYYKIVPKFFSTSNILVRTDRLKNWKEIHFEIENMPDKILVNGEEYILVKV